jgi:hypothetical protein
MTVRSKARGTGSDAPKARSLFRYLHKSALLQDLVIGIKKFSSPSFGWTGSHDVAVFSPSLFPSGLLKIKVRFRQCLSRNIFSDPGGDYALYRVDGCIHT